MKRFIVQLKKHLNKHQDALVCFCKHGVQVEGWIKGEILCLLDSGIVNKKVIGFDREVNIGLGRKKVDFSLVVRTDSGSQRLWIETKHWLIGYQRGTRWNANSYFSDASSVGIKPDVEKLMDIPRDGKFLLVLATANPGENDWVSGIQKFNSKFRQLHVKSLTNPRNFPSSYFLGLLKVHAHT